VLFEVSGFVLLMFLVLYEVSDFVLLMFSRDFVPEKPDWENSHADSDLWALWVEI